jgi:hypothetical protein
MEYTALPCEGCRKYNCPVAFVEPPDYYFSWILECYTLQSAGFTIENKQLKLAEWRDLGVLRGLLDMKKEQDSLASVSQEMLLMISKASRRR